MSGGITKDATVRVGVEVDQDITSTAQRLFAPIERAAQRTESALKSLGASAGQAISNVALDIARTATALNTIDLAGQVNRYVRYREELARTAASVGASWEQLGQRYKAVGDRLATSDEALAKVARGLQQTTFDATDSSQAIEALGNEALETNRSLDQLAPLGEALHNELGQSFGAIPEALGRIRSAANELGTTGGPAALQAQLATLGAAISQFSIRSKSDFGLAIGSVAALGRGLPAVQQARVQQRVLARLESDTEGLRRQLGIRYEEFYDEQGHIREDLGGIIERVQKLAVKRFGLRAREVLSQPQNFGNAETAAAILAFNRDDERRAATATMTTEAVDQAKAFRDSGVGEDIAKRHRIEQDKRDQAGKALADFQTGSYIEGHPFLTTLLTQTALFTGARYLQRFFAPQALAGGAAAAEGTAFGGGVAAAGVAARTSQAGRAATNLFRLVGFGSSSIGLGALAAAGATTYASAKLTGLARFNETIDQQRAQLEAQFEAEREGRARAIVRAAERASAAGFTPEGYRDELGPRLVGEISQDPALQSVASGAVNGTVSAGLDQQAPALATILREALKDVQLNVQVELQDDTGSPHRIVSAQRGARQ